ncbi:MAG: TIGR02391 family protein [Clostridia bacterium]|nr:TIGR02391 family protein [Clostridia bacterium]
MDNAIFLKAQMLQEDIDACSGVLPRKDAGSRPSVDFFDQLITDKALRKTVEKLYRDGHHARAVEEAYKFIDNLVKRTAKQSETNLTGSKLMTAVFSGNAPILKINAGESTSERDEQIGYMQIFSGCMTGIRNPRAHECDWEDSEQRALQLLVWANHLVERIHLSEKA